MRKIILLTTAIFLMSCAESTDAPTIDLADKVETSVVTSSETQTAAMKAAEAKVAAMKAAEAKAAAMKATEAKAAAMKAAEAKAAAMKAAEAKATAMKAEEAKAAAMKAAEVKQAEIVEASRVEALRQESLRQEAERNAAQAEAQRQENLRQEAERKATQAEAQRQEGLRQESLRQEEAKAAAAYREISTGSWTKKTFSVKGSWKISTENGVTTISLDDNFSTKNAPDLKIFLSPLSATSVSNKTAVNGSALISPLRSNKGAQSYTIPTSVNISQYKSIIIHCEAYTKLWSAADL